MRRRWLAWVIACSLAVVALSLGGGVAFLELSTRDYVLAWRLRHTVRIELSSPWEGSRVIEVTQPDEVAELVSAMTAKLDRVPQRRVTCLMLQVRFFLDDGKEIIAAVDHWDPLSSVTCLVRLAGERSFRTYSMSLYAPRFSPRFRKPISLGQIPVRGAAPIALTVDWCWKSPYGGNPTFLIGSSDWPPDAKGRLMGDVKFMGRHGLLTLHDDQTAWNGVSLEPGRIEYRDVAFGLDELEAVLFTTNGQTTTLPLPRLRYHDLILPPCPTCGSTSVVPCIYEWNEECPPPFKGRCKLMGGVERDRPRFFCESCRKAF